MVIVAFFIAKLLSPDIIIISGLAGWFSRAWWHVAIGVVVAAVVNEALLSAMQRMRDFNPLMLLIGIAAAAAWAFGIYALRRRHLRKKAESQTITS